MTSSHDGFHWSKAEVERVISIQHAAEQNICHELWATRQLEIRDQGLSERCTFPGAFQQEFRGLLQRRVLLDGLGHGLGGVVTHSRVPSLHTVYTVWRRRRCHSNPRLLPGVAASRRRSRMTSPSCSSSAKHRARQSRLH